MRVVVDLNRCQGYAQCAFLAPDAFAIRGDEVLVYDPAPEERHRVEVLRAAAACPVRAIAVGERVARTVAEAEQGVPLPRAADAARQESRRS